MPLRSSSRATSSQFTLDGAPASEDNRPLCAERFLHAAIYAARPEVNSVLCAGSEDVLPFSITPTPLCAVLGTVGDMGTHVPVWDIAEKFGEDTDLAVSTWNAPAIWRSVSAAIASS